MKRRRNERSRTKGTVPIELAIAKIRMDGGTQPRAETDELVVEDYADAYRAGKALPANIVFYDGSDYWLADGFHRTLARKEAGFKTVLCDVRQGTRRDAILYSLSANAEHGLRRTNADKRRQVEGLLQDPEWSGWTDRRIAEHAQVSHPFVASIREELSSRGAIGTESTRTASRNGKEYETSTGRLSPAIRKLIQNTALAENREVLRNLAAIEDPQRQRAVAEMLLGGRAKTVSQAELTLTREARHRGLVAAAASAAPTTDAAWQIIDGDNLVVMVGMPPQSRRLIVADPQYNIGVDYGNGAKADRLTEVDYLDRSDRWIQEASRILTDDGALCIVINWEYQPQLVTIARDAGFTWFPITWYESFGVNCTHRFNRCTRPILWLVKDPENYVFNEKVFMRPSARQAIYNDKRANPDGKLWDDLWGIEPIPAADGTTPDRAGSAIPRLVGNAAERMKDFPTQLPLALLRPIVAGFSNPGDQVMDIFNGSGTTGAACLELGRIYTGIEIDPATAAKARLRLTAAASEAAAWARNGGARDCLRCMR